MARLTIVPLLALRVKQFQVQFEYNRDWGELLDLQRTENTLVAIVRYNRIVLNRDISELRERGA